MSFIRSIPPKTLHEQFGLYHGNWFPEMDRSWEDFDRGYSVCSRMINTKFGNVEHVSIVKHRKEGEPLVTFDGERNLTWAEKMMIKNELFGEDRFAIEVFPKKEYLVDTADTYHLWVFNKKYDMIFGIHPKEYSKAINRGVAPLSKDELTLLQKKFDEQKDNGVDYEQLFNYLC